MTRMLWVGGAPGAGKSTVARTLALAEDLPVHAIDLWTYDHVGRLPAAPTLDEDLARGPAAAADSFEAQAALRMPLLHEDLAARDLGEVPALVEGPQLHPRLWPGAPAGSTVWLVPAVERTRAAREERLAAVEQPGARARLDGLMARDAVLADRLRSAAREAGHPVVEVGPDVDWATVRTAVRTALAPVLDHATRLVGAALGDQRARENRTACRQGRLWQRAASIAALPPFPFACECGRSGCAATWAGTPDEYDAATRSGRLLAHDATGAAPGA